MNKPKFTNEQRNLIYSLARIGKTSCEIADIVGLKKESVKGILCGAKRTGKLEYVRKCEKRNYHNEPLVPPPDPETLTEREAKVYTGKFDSVNIPVIKFKSEPYKSIFDVRV